MVKTNSVKEERPEVTSTKQTQGEQQLKPKPIKVTHGTVQPHKEHDIHTPIALMVCKGGACKREGIELIFDEYVDNIHSN